jgi:MscS family membrane protein
MSVALHHLIIRCLYVALLGMSFAAVAADDSEPAPASEPKPIPESLRSPRATMETFLDAMNATRAGEDAQIEQAISTLDLSAVSPLIRTEKGRDAAWMLQEVIDHTRIPNTKRVSTRTTGKPYIFNTYENGAIEIAFVDNVGWQFSSATVAALPALLDEVSTQEKVEGVTDDGVAHLPVHLKLRAMIPPRFKEEQLILEQWQWFGIAAIILAGFIVDKLIAMLLALGVRIWRARWARGVYREVPDTILRPFGLMVMAFMWWAGVNMLGLPASALLILLVSVKFLACLATVWVAYRLVDLTAAFLNQAASRTQSKLDDALVPLVTKTLKVFVTVMGVVFIADNLNIDVTSLLAGLGLGGLAFALAAKDVAGNLFGSITVLLDQTFHVGDWVIIGDVEGSVEHIGFRSTRIRTFYNSLVSVPNSTLITAAVDNMGARTYRRLSCKFAIAYDTPPERIEAFCEGIREIVRQHPYTRKDSYHVYLNGFSASALEILVYIFWRTPEWGTELRERHRFLIDCLRLAKRLGVEFAYPTQTVHLKQAENGLPDPETGLFSPARSEGDAHTYGIEEARAIVAATTGLGVVPPPVTLTGKGRGTGDNGE